MAWNRKSLRWSWKGRRLSTARAAAELVRMLKELVKELGCFASGIHRPSSNGYSLLAFLKSRQSVSESPEDSVSDIPSRRS